MTLDLRSWRWDLFFQQAIWYCDWRLQNSIITLYGVYEIQILHCCFKGEHEKELLPWYWACRSFSQVCFHFSCQGSKFKLLKGWHPKLKLRNLKWWLQEPILWIKTCLKGSLLPQKPELEFLLSERGPDARALHCPCQGGLQGRP